MSYYTFSEIFICEFCVTWSSVFSLYVACLFRTDINALTKSKNPRLFISIFSNCLLIWYIFTVCCRVHFFVVCFRISFFLNELISNYWLVSNTFSEIFIRVFCITCSCVFSLFVACLIKSGIATLLLLIFSNSLLNLYSFLASVLDDFWLLFLWFLQSLDYFHSTKKLTVGWFFSITYPIGKFKENVWFVHLFELIGTLHIKVYKVYISRLNMLDVLNLPGSDDFALFAIFNGSTYSIGNR